MHIRSIPIFIAAATMAATLACNPNLDDIPTWRETFAELDSGVKISVEISEPKHGVTVPNKPLPVTGFATIGETSPVAQTTLAYVVDVSGSTLSGGGCGGDINGDGYFDTILDCQVAALLKVHEMAIATGTVLDVGASVFGTTAATADVQPGGTDNDLLTMLDADIDGDGVTDIEQVLRSLKVGAIGQFTPHAVGLATSYGAGLQAIVPALSASAQPHKLVVFVSDGKNNTAPNINAIIPTLPAGTVVHTFAVGDNSACDVNLLYGSLQNIADATGGSCTEVPHVADLPNVIPAVIGAKLIGLTLTANGVPVDIDHIDPVVPQIGPKTITYSTKILGLAPGEHQLCATATGMDALGQGDVSECVTIYVNHPPRVSCQDVSIAADATCHADASIEGVVWDPDDDDEVTCVVDPEGPYPLGTTEVTLTCTDSHRESSSCTATIEVVDETPPALEKVEVLAVLWPPNHEYTELSIEGCVGAVTDNCEEDIVLADVLKLVRVTSDEPELGLGSGKTCEDIEITGPTTFRVRSERMGGGDGRVYTAFFNVLTEGGELHEQTCQVLVPVSQNPNAAIIDSGCKLCVGEGCEYCPTVQPACN